MTMLMRFIAALALVLLPHAVTAEPAQVAESVETTDATDATDATEGAEASEAVEAVETAAGQGSAHDVIRAATEQVMSEVEAAQEYIDEDSDRFYNTLTEILDPVVDFRGFARGVMGPYASSERYRSLDPEGREQLREQLERFSEVMREGLVRTYGKGLLAFTGSRIEMPDPEAADDATRVAVQQLIHSSEKSPYEVVYHMGRDSDGRWKLRNMVIEDVNLGKIYRSQFESAARKHDGDLDQVIANWSAVELDDA